MTGATLPVKLVAVVMAIGVVSGFATGSITYAAYSDSEDASVSISAGSNWGSGDTGAGGDQSDISVVDLEVRPEPVPRSRGTFTIDLVVDSATIDSVSDGTLHVTESPESVLHAERLIAHDENTSDDRSTVSMKFGTALLFQYVDAMDEVDATVSITLDGGTEVSADGSILLKGKSAGRVQTPNAGPEDVEQADANNSTATDDTVSNRTSTSNTTDGEKPIASGKHSSGLATGTDDTANRSRPGNTTDTADGTDPGGTNLTAENGTVAVYSGSETGSKSTNETSIGEMNETNSTTTDATDETNSTTTDATNETNSTTTDATNETNSTTTDATNETTTDETNVTTSTNTTDDGNTSDLDGTQTTVTDSDTLPYDSVSGLLPMAQILVDATLGTESILEHGPRVPVQGIPVDVLDIRVDTVVTTIVH